MAMTGELQRRLGISDSWGLEMRRAMKDAGLIE
jgi:hypothetical protein